MNKQRPGCNLEFFREDDYVEYFVFPELPDSETEDLLSQLAAVQAQCDEIVARLVNKSKYIWHKDEYRLTLRMGTEQELLLNDELKAGAERLPPHFHGVTHYGQNIADEWFIVYLLCEITREVPHCIVRVIDSDGEFLLIEAAEELPKWANAETCEQRVYIVSGGLQLVQNSPSNTTKLMPVATAVNKIRQNPTLYRVSKEVQECIDERLKEFHSPNSALHHQILRLPLGVAALLKERPSLIAPAVRSFCERHPVDMRACRSMRYFPPEQRVRTNVCFTRCLYAMIMHSNYVPDRKIGWNLNGATNTEQYKEDLLGVKVASGFEILASQAKYADDDKNDAAWKAYVHSLTEKGFFRGNLEGSEDYKRLLTEAKTYFDNNNGRFRTVPLVGRDIIELLRSIDINADKLRDEESNLQANDSDEWLNISAEQLDAMLTERYGPTRLYKSNDDVNGEEFTKNITKFLEKQSAFDGIENDAHNAGDAIVSGTTKPMDEFKAKVRKNMSMRKACNQNPIDASTSQDQIAAAQLSEDSSFTTHVRNFLDFVIPEDNWDSNSEMSDYEDEDDLERDIEAMSNPEKNIDLDIKAYMAQMDKELSRTTVGQTFANSGSSGAKEPASATASAEDDFDDIETFEPININVNTLKNMMDSYKSQTGAAGPVSNLLSAMGIGMSASNGVLSTETKDISESTV